MKEMLEYILFRLPIFLNDNENGVSLEEIAKEFKMDRYEPEATQEEIAEYLLNKAKELK